jgi:hypothetical protein
MTDSKIVLQILWSILIEYLLHNIYRYAIDIMTICLRAITNPTKMLMIKSR